MSGALALAASADRAPDACWSRVGVRGDRSCPELVQHVHCRNCPVFASAARQLLDRPLPSGYVRSWSSHFGAAKAASKAGTRSAVAFRLGSEWFALPTEVFDEITETRKVHTLPHRRNPAVLGLVNVRGELIVCISLLAMLGLAEAPPAEADRGVARARLAVVRHGSGPISFPADEVRPAFRYDDTAMMNVPATVQKAGHHYTRGLLAWQDRTVGYLDVDRLFDAVSQSLA
jgi:chemotaxis-related protein WspD